MNISVKSPITLLKSLLITLMVLSLFQSCKKKETPDISLRIQSFIGDVKIVSVNAEAEPKLGDNIKQSSTIRTGKSSLIDIRFGNRGIIRINENSDVLVAKLLATRKGGETLLDMKNGKLFITVSKLKKGVKVGVKTPTAIAAVRGTSFRITADEKSSKIDVLSGKIKVNPVKNGKVIEEVETVIEENKAVVLDVKTVEEIVEKKKEIEVVTLKPEDIKEIKEEVKDIKVEETMDEAVKKEVQEVVLEKKKDDDDAKKKEEELRLIEKRKEKLENRKRTETETRKTQLEKERLEKERLAKERVEKERIERERIEREKEKARKETEKKENRVKNIPNL